MGSIPTTSSFDQINLKLKQACTHLSLESWGWASPEGRGEEAADEAAEVGGLLKGLDARGSSPSSLALGLECWDLPIFPWPNSLCLVPPLSFEERDLADGVLPPAAAKLCAEGKTRGLDLLMGWEWRSELELESGWSSPFSFLFTSSNCIRYWFCGQPVASPFKSVSHLLI